MSDTTFQNKHIVVIGGTSGLGFAVAEAAILNGAFVHIAGREKARLDDALDQLGHRASGSVVDVMKEPDIANFFDSIPHVDHLVVTAAVNEPSDVVTSDIDILRINMESRFWGAVYSIRHAVPHMPPEGSITLTSGMATHKPPRGLSIATAAAGALETFVRALAIELSPIRINVINPGPINTPLLQKALGGTQDAVGSLGESLPLGKVGEPSDFGHAALFAMTNRNLSGTTLHLDGAAPWI